MVLVRRYWRVTVANTLPPDSVWPHSLADLDAFEVRRPDPN
jgi:hypothetical protein